MGSKSSTPPAAPNPADQAVQISNARDITDPREAQRFYDILSNPNYGLLPSTQLQEDVRSQVFPQEQQVRQQLGTNVLGALSSPTGISPEQQAAVTARRSQAQGELQKAIRERANLGGGLYGGNAIDQEAKSVGELQNAFAESDINRETTARLNAIQSAIPYLQLLFPNSGIVAPQFQSAVQSPDTYSSALTTQRGQDMTFQAQQDANRTALYSALFSGVGSGVGAFMGAKK